VDVASEIAGLDRGNWRVKVTKDVVEKCFAEAEKCGDEDGGFEGLADVVRTKVLEALIAGKDVDEGYETGTTEGT
jgi:hypothetical protein